MILLTTTVLHAAILLLLFSREYVVEHNLLRALAWSSHTPSGVLLGYLPTSCRENAPQELSTPKCLISMGFARLFYHRTYCV